MKKENLILGTLILTVATTITRIIGFIFRIYLANVLGAEGIGLFQLIISFYILMVTLSTSGIRIAVSRLMSEEIAMGHYSNAKRVLRQSIALSFFTGFFAAFLMYYFSNYVGTNILKDERTVLSLLYLVPSLPVIAVSSCYKGYFYAVGKVTKPASAQVLEQVIRVFVIFSIMNYYLPKGLGYGCAAVSIGMTIEEIFSLIYIWFLYITDKKPYSNKTKTKPDNMIFKILGIAIPLSATAYVNSILRMVENILIPSRLIIYGSSTVHAMSLYGMVKGMVLPLLFFPSSFLTSLASILIPSVAGENAISNEKKVTYTLSKVLHFTALSGILVVSIFLCFPNEIGMTVYNDPQVWVMLKIISFVCPFMYLNMVIASMLNALGEQVSSFKINIVESILKISIIYFLIPLYGFNAYIFALFITTLLNTILYLIRLLQVSCIIFDISNWIFKPVIAAIISSIVSRILFILFLSNTSSEMFVLISSIIILCFLYLIFLILLKSINTTTMKNVKTLVKH
ncbi:stage V sporulation protein B [Sedimentibacter acidaminivorans]|uniref:Stage V sporulation protein B n=1 Tax=Sedimentibacter acidaminivorans TaxID=913099 RepID=A0ABS4GFA5_9FIRM|nr:polysaccharide biosynthesis protein [Sedimentibacter acidaminivorans]MBP1926380.1 stage V sporulation protein B [Sedimentibacter acidaminivorans]